jgi:hypothetical protein
MDQVSAAGRAPASGSGALGLAAPDSPLACVPPPAPLRAMVSAPRARFAAASVAAFAGLAAVASLLGCGGSVRSPTEPAGGGGPGAQALTFDQIQTGIFTPSCAKAGCHASSSASGGLVLAAGQAYADIVGQPAQEEPQLVYIRPGNPEASYLLKKVRGDPDITGGHMPLDGPPFLSPQQIAGLAAWIQAGAPRN